MPVYKFWGPLKVYVSCEIEADTLEEAEVKAEDVLPRVVVSNNSIQGGLEITGPFVHGSSAFHATDCYPELDLDE